MKFNSHFLFFVSTLLLPAGFVPAVQAGSPSLSPSALNAPADITPPRLVFDVTFQYEFSEYSPAGPGGNVVETRVSLPLFIPLSKQWKLIGALGGGYTDYETDPFGGDGMQTYKVGGLLTLTGQFTDVWSGSFGLLGGASWEDGASFSDGLNGGGLIEAGYRFSPSLKVGLGGLYLTRQNEDALIVPALGLDWQVSDAFKVTLIGLNLRAEHDLNPSWSIFLRGEFDPGGAILAKRPNSDADSFIDEGFRTAVGLKWTPTRSFSLSMESGVAFHEYTLLNDRSEIFAKEKLDPALFISISARLSF